MTPEQMERFAKHQPYMASPRGTSVDWTEECEECGADWPCDVGVLWAEIGRLRDALREAWEGIASNIARTDEEIADLTDERDSLRAALDQANRLLRYVLHLRMYGENAPGGNETWRQADRDIEHHLRAIEGES